MLDGILCSFHGNTLLAQSLHKAGRSGNVEGMNVLVSESSIACVHQQERTALLEVKVWQ